MKDLFTNRSSEGDFVFNALDRYARNCEVRIASAFFSADEIVKELTDRNCTVRLVVRLGAMSVALLELSSGNIVS